MSPPINGVATSITAFIGSAQRGPTELPGSVNSFADFERLYGGLWAQSTLGYAVQQFFLNGGSQALIVRVHNGATAAKATVPAGGINLIAVNAGAWGNSLRARVD
ncbi:MAG TPA: phage tail sheath family protein, partial [Bradyrhizobium sp.]|nr:phage tail sheath family protein [Bradyrhizobium sp.]